MVILLKRSCLRKITNRNRKMKKTLIVVDMQKDFVDGSLGTKEAVGILENVKKKIEEYRKMETKSFLRGKKH